MLLFACCAASDGSRPPDPSPPAIPAVNCVSSSSVNAILEAAREVNSPVMLQVSNGRLWGASKATSWRGVLRPPLPLTLEGCILFTGGAAFYAGKGMKNDGEKAAVLGTSFVLLALGSWRLGALLAAVLFCSLLSTPISPRDTPKAPSLLRTMCATWPSTMACP